MKKNGSLQGTVKNSAVLIGSLSVSVILKKSTDFTFISLEIRDDGNISTAFFSSLAAEL